MKRYRVDFGYGRYFFDPKEDGDWVRFEDAQSVIAMRDEGQRLLMVQIEALQKALIRAVGEHGHKWGCSAGRGLDSDCHCGWTEIRALVKQISPKTQP